MVDKDISATFWEHVDDLRSMLLRTFLVIGIGFAVCLFFHQELFAILTKPLNIATSQVQLQQVRRERIYNPGPDSFAYAAENPNLVDTSEGVREVSSGIFLIPEEGYLIVDRPVPSNRLALFGPLDGILITFKTCFWVALAATSPVWMFFILAFIAPALHPPRRRLIFPFLALSFLFFFFGFLFAYYLTIPMANRYLSAFNLAIAENFWSLAHYLDYTVILLLASGLAFQLCVVLLFLVHFRLISHERMGKWRRGVILGAFIVSAVLTPPDPLTQVMLAIPLIALYELSMLYAKLRA